MGSPKTSHTLAIPTMGIATNKGQNQVFILDDTPDSMTMRYSGMAYSFTTRQITQQKYSQLTLKSVLKNNHS